MFPVSPSDSSMSSSPSAHLSSPLLISPDLLGARPPANSPSAVLNTTLSGMSLIGRAVPAASTSSMDAVRARLAEIGAERSLLQPAVSQLGYPQTAAYFTAQMEMAKKAQAIALARLYEAKTVSGRATVLLYQDTIIKSLAAKEYETAKGLFREALEQNLLHEPLEHGKPSQFENDLHNSLIQAAGWHKDDSFTIEVYNIASLRGAVFAPAVHTSVYLAAKKTGSLQLANQMAEIIDAGSRSQALAISNARHAYSHIVEDLVTPQLRPLDRGVSLVARHSLSGRFAPLPPTPYARRAPQTANAAQAVFLASRAARSQRESSRPLLATLSTSNMPASAAVALAQVNAEVYSGRPDNAYSLSDLFGQDQQ